MWKGRSHKSLVLCLFFIVCNSERRSAFAAVSLPHSCVTATASRAATLVQRQPSAGCDPDKWYLIHVTLGPSDGKRIQLRRCSTLMLFPLVCLLASVVKRLMESDSHATAPRAKLSDSDSIIEACCAEICVDFAPALTDAGLFYRCHYNRWC